MFRAVFSVKNFLDNSLDFLARDYELWNFKTCDYNLSTDHWATHLPWPLSEEVWVCCRLSLSLHPELTRLSTESWLSWAGRWDQALQTVGTWGEKPWAGEPCLVRKVGLAESGWSWTVYWLGCHTLCTPSVWRVTAVPTGNGQCWGRGEEVTRRMGRLRKILALKGGQTIAGEETQDIQTVPGLSREPSVSVSHPCRGWNVDISPLRLLGYGQLWTRGITIMSLMDKPS